MKKILFIIWLMLSTQVFSQTFETLASISEIEKSTRYDKAGTINIYNTIEDHLYNFEKTYGRDELNVVLNHIEDNTIIAYHATLSGNKAFYVADMYRVIKNYKICFIYNGKIYVLTYEPVNCNKYGNKEVDVIVKKYLYLYRRDSDGWEEVSDLISTHNRNDSGMTELSPYKSSAIIKDGLLILDYYLTIGVPDERDNRITHYHYEKSVLTLKL
jgi:hypothetical protein